MNKEERNALVSFLSIYFVSAMVLVSIIAILYYKKEMVAIQDKCTIEMVNAALSVEKELMSAEMDNSPYMFASPSENLRVGLFDDQGKVLYSNLSTDEVLLSQRAYKSNTHEYHVDSLKKPVLGVKYIVIEGNEGVKEKYKLLILIGVVVLVTAIFIALVGYYLSKLLIAPIKSRMAKLNSFIKDSSHDLNTPVSALMMSVSSLRQKECADARTLNHISISAKLISQIYNSLSFIAFHERDEVFDEYFDLSDVVRESVKFFEDIASSKGHEILVELESTTVFMDRSRLQKVINNLISNALKYSYPKSEIKIELKENIFRIQDQGPGIEEKDKDVIFNRYERKNSSAGGFGIGLDIVRSVCEHYGIKVQVDSKPNQGTAFILYLPNKLDA